MSKSKEFLSLLEMSYERKDWIAYVRDRYLGGALGEYTKVIIARKLGFKDYWSNEVKRILNNINLFMDKKEVVVRGNRKLMLKEAMREASIKQPQITDAKNEMTKMFKSKWREILRLDLPSKELFSDMIKEFLPEYADLLPS